MSFTQAPGRKMVWLISKLIYNLVDDVSSHFQSSEQLINKVKLLSKVQLIMPFTQAPGRKMLWLISKLIYNLVDDVSSHFQSSEQLKNKATRLSKVRLMSFTQEPGRKLCGL